MSRSKHAIDCQACLYALAQLYFSSRGEEGTTKGAREGAIDGKERERDRERERERERGGGGMREIEREGCLKIEEVTKALR